jgi:hypothetical protein
MTDTPRTEAELLTDFADQQNHGITAQKMRNLIVSGGFGPMWDRTAQIEMASAR